MVDSAGRTEIKDFSFGTEPKKFRVNDDLFEARPEMPLTLMGRASQLMGTALREDPEKILTFFDELLLPESALLFRDGVLEKKTIGVRHIVAILPWLLEEYGLRPPTPSENSSTGSDGTGTTSTDGAPSEESTPSDSPLPGL